MQAVGREAMSQRLREGERGRSMQKLFPERAEPVQSRRSNTAPQKAPPSLASATHCLVLHCRAGDTPVELLVFDHARLDQVLHRHLVLEQQEAVACGGGGGRDGESGENERNSEEKVLRVKVNVSS